MNNLRVAYGVLLLLMILLVSGSAFAGEKKTLAFLPGTLENPSQAYAAKMFQRYGSDYGFDVVIMDSPGADAQAQIENVNECIAKGVDVIAVNPNDIITIVPYLRKAKKDGIVVCLFSSDLPAEFVDARDIFCGVDDTVAGEVAAKAFIDQFPNGAKIVEIGGQNGHDAQIKRNQGFQKGISGSNIEVLATQNCSAWDTANAKEVMDTFVAALGDEIQGVFCHWDNGATGIIQSLEEAGIDNVFIVGVDGCSNGFKQIMDGKQSVTIAQSIENIAKTTMERARQKLDGEQVEAINFIAFETIGKNNINDYEMPEW